MTYAVYWTRYQTDNNCTVGYAQAKMFDGDGMMEALKLVEELRKEQREGGPIGFVTFCSENPNSVGNPGAADVEPGYNWKKRRV